MQMPEENIEIVRRVYESLTCGDDAWRDLAAPELVVDFSRRRIDPFVAHGSNDPVLSTLQAQTSEIWEGPPVWEPLELIAAGNMVFAFIRMRSRGKGSGALVEAHVANVWTFRDGKVIEFAYFGEDRAAAVEAAGLPGRPMPLENVEIVRRCYQSLALRDWDGLWRDAHPDFVLKTQRQGSYRGSAESRDFIQDQIAAFASSVQEPDEFIASGDQVVVLVTHRAQPKGTNAEIEIKVAHVWTLQDGKVLLLETFPRREDALRAAGLSG